MRKTLRGLQQIKCVRLESCQRLTKLISSFFSFALGNSLFSPFFFPLIMPSLSCFSMTNNKILGFLICSQNFSAPCFLVVRSRIYHLFFPVFFRNQKQVRERKRERVAEQKRLKDSRRRRNRAGNEPRQTSPVFKRHYTEKKRKRSVSRSPRKGSKRRRSVSNNDRNRRRPEKVNRARRMSPRNSNQDGSERNRFRQRSRSPNQRRAPTNSRSQRNGKVLPPRRDRPRREKAPRRKNFQGKPRVRVESPLRADSTMPPFSDFSSTDENYASTDKCHLADRVADLAAESVNAWNRTMNVDDEFDKEERREMNRELIPKKTSRHEEAMRRRKAEEQEETRRKEMKKKRLKLRSKISFEELCEVRDKDEAIEEGKNLLRNLPEIRNQKGERTVLASESKIRSETAYVTPSQSQFVDRLFAKKEKNSEIRHKVPLLIHHRKFLQKQKQRPCNFGIQLACPEMPSLEEASVCWMDFLSVLNLKDSRAQTFSKHTEIFGDLKDPGDWAEINGLIFHIKGLRNNHYGSFPPFPAIALRNRDFVDFFADSRIKNKTLFSCPFDQLSGVYMSKMTAILAKMQAFPLVRKLMSFSKKSMDFGPKSLFFEMNEIFLRGLKNPPLTDGIGSLDPLNPRSAAFVETVDFEESVQRFFTGGPSKYDRLKNANFANYYKNHRKENPAWKNSFSLAKDEPLRNRIPESSYLMKEGDSERDRVFRVESWTEYQNRFTIKGPPLDEDDLDRCLMKFARTTIQGKGMAEKHITNPMDPLLMRALVSLFAHNLGGIMFLFEVLEKDFRSKGQTPKAANEFISKLKQILTSSSLTCDHAVQKTVSVFEQNKVGWPHDGKPHRYMDLIAEICLLCPTATTRNNTAGKIDSSCISDVDFGWLNSDKFQDIWWKAKNKLKDSRYIANKYKNISFERQALAAKYVNSKHFGHATEEKAYNDVVKSSTEKKDMENTLGKADSKVKINGGMMYDGNALKFAKTMMAKEKGKMAGAENFVRGNVSRAPKSKSQNSGHEK